MSSMHELFTSLQENIDGENYEDALKVVNKILAQKDDDLDALKCKVLCLINLGQFDQLVTFINGLPNKDSFALEKAYCFYRTRKFDEALEILIPYKDDVNFLTLKAQVFYSLEKFKDAAKSYNDIISAGTKTNDILTNLCACYVQDENFDKIFELVKSNQDIAKNVFEFIYNYACAYVKKGDYKKAEEFLDLAKTVCKATLKDDGLSDEQIKDELSIIDAQFAYVQQRQGRVEEAMKQYTEIMKLKPSDSSVRAVVENNVVGLREGDKFDSLRKFQKLQNEETQNKLVRAQKEAMAFNHGLLLLHLNKNEECRELIQQLQVKYPSNGYLPLLSASILMKEKQPQQAQKLLEEFAAKHPETSVRTKLCIAQMYLNAKNIPEVIKTLEGIESLRNSPALICSLVQLYQKTNNIDEAINILDVGVKSLDKNASYYPVILKKNAEFKYSCGKYQEAAKMYRQLLEFKKTDLETIAYLVMACSFFDAEAARQFEAKLPNIDLEDPNLDAEKLESLSVPTFQKKEKLKELTVSQNKKPDEKKKRKKKKNKPPKKMDPNFPPDPERWLPRNLRSSNKNKRKGNKNRGAQGAIGASVAVTGEAKTIEIEKVSQQAGRGVAGTRGRGTGPTRKRGRRK